MNEFKNDFQKLKSIIKDIKYAMLSTVSDDGSIHSRPMATLSLEQFDGSLFFFSRKNSIKNHNIETEQHVNLSYINSGKGQYISISGRASIIDDKSQMKKFWTPALKTWFPEGLNDPELTLLNIKILDAEIWDSSHNKIHQMVNFVKSTLTGRPIELEQHTDFINVDGQHLMSEEEKLDETLKESFPASDPPGHISKSAEDLKQY